MGLFLGLTVILLDDARRDGDAWTAHRAAECDEFLVYLEIAFAHAFVGNCNRIF
jgi:hypothetical protein